MATSTLGAFGEVNRKHWDTQVEQISKEPWIQNLTRQIYDHLRSNLSWMGIQQSSQMPTKMLDYACGPGTASRAMLPHVTEIRGIDVSDSMVDKFNAGAREADVSEIQMHAVRGDLLAPAQGSLESQDFYGFDLAIMSMALHHVDDPETIVAKLVERLKPGGTVVVIDWIPSGRALSQSNGSHSHDHSHGYGTDSGHSSAGDPEQHPGSHTISFDGFTKEHMDGMFAKAKCSEIDYVLAASPSEVPPDPSGQKQMFFAKGMKHKR